MKNYSLKEVFYKNSYLLNEMAIITPRNFLEKTVKLCNDKPSLIGIPSIASVEEAFDYIEDSLYKKHKYMTQADVNKFLEKLKAEYDEKESSRQKSVEIRKSKGIKVNEKDLQPITLTDDIKQQKLDLFEATSVKEKNVILEILKIVKVTDLLNLKGKENKKRLKEAEEILSVQLRKHINSDGEGIEFKNILPMFDNIIKYVESKGDVDFDLCIKNADLYMRNFYNIARSEEKEIIDKGDFDFSTIMKRISFVRDSKEYDRQNSEYMSKTREDYVLVFEDKDMIIRYPTTYDKFRDILLYDYDVPGDFEWCTFQGRTTWINYNSNEYVAIAHSKNVAPGHPAWAISLKIKKSGEINGSGTCDYNNAHVGDKWIDKWFSDEAKEAVRKLPKIVDLVIDPEDMEKLIKGYAELNDISSLKESFSKSLAYCGEEETQNMFYLLCNETQMSKSQCAEIIVENISYFMFDNPNGEFLYFTDFFKSSDEYPTQEILAYLKEKISNPRSHARYFNAFLILEGLAKDIIPELSFEEFLKSTETACSSTNTNNLKRIITLLLRSDRYAKYLNAKAITNKKAGLTNKNIDFYNMLIETSCVKEYIKEKGIHSLKGTGRFIINAEEFLSLLMFRYKDRLISSIQENNPEIEDVPMAIDLTLVASYIADEARFVDFFDRRNEHRFLTIDKDTYNDFKQDMLVNYDTWSLLKDKFSKQEGHNLLVLLSYIISNKIKKIEINDNLFKILDDLMSFSSLGTADIFTNLYAFLFYFKKDLTSLNNKSLLNIKKSLTEAAVAEDGLISQRFYSAIADDSIDQKESEFRYKLFSLLDNQVKYDILLRVYEDLDAMFFRKTGLFHNYLADFNNNTKKYFEGLDIIRIIKSLNSFSLKMTACFLDSVSLEDKAKLLAECIESMVTPNLADHTNNYYETDTVQKLDINILKHPKVLDAFKNNKNDISLMYGKHSYITNFIHHILQVFNNNSVAFPKETLSHIILNNKNNRQAYLRGIEALLTNFISISEDGSNTLYGKELTIVRDTLKTLYNFKGGINKTKNKYVQSSGLLFKMPQVKEIVFKLVSKMNKHARMHMTLAFPDERSQLTANTPEEDAEIQADSLIRMYIKMLLS
jgi:hypothetical protein